VGRGVPADRVTLVPNCVDERFLEPLPDPAGPRSSLGIAPDEVAVGIVSTLVGYEGVDVLLRAVRLLIDRGAPVRLLVVGDGASLPGLRRLADGLGLENRAVFVGRVPYTEVRRYYAALDVFVVPRLDTRVTRLVTPLKPLEAMASGRPVVASDLPALAELVGGGRGVLARPGEPASLADVLEPLLYDPDRRGRLGSTARRWVAEHRTWAAVVPRYLEVYRGLGAL
jgi:glycosyltransferase involved in cell wall biosynthesis